MSQLSFILTGTYSSLNKGDAAMQLTTAQQLIDRWPNSQVTVSTPFPGLDSKAYPNASIIQSSRRRLIWGTLQVFRARLYSLTGQRFAFLIRNQELRSFASCSMIIDLSGDTITEDYGPHVTYSHLLPIMLGLAFKKPVFVCAQSIGPFRLTSLFTKYVLNKTNYITAREEVTYKKLLDFGVKKEILELTSDMAFLMKPVSEKEVKKILLSEKIPDSTPFIGVSVSDLVRNIYDKQPRNSSTFVNEVASALDTITNQHDATVLFVSHVVGPSTAKDDRIIADAVAKKMTANSYALQGDYRPDELKGVISKCRIFIGARMHSNIAALSSSVPTIAIGYSQKTKGIMESLHMENYVLPIKQLDNEVLSSLATDLFSSRSSVSKKLTLNVRKIQRKSSRNVDIASSLLKQKES